jgi:hypothetical protein
MKRHAHKDTPPNDLSYQYPAYRGTYICLLCAATFSERPSVIEHYLTAHSPSDVKKVGMRHEVLATRSKRTAKNEALYREVVDGADTLRAPPNKKRLKSLSLK